jgi:Histidine kinase-, DNA gyrase B-, and HSP90-like ATPase
VSGTRLFAHAQPNGTSTASDATMPMTTRSDRRGFQCLVIDIGHSGDPAAGPYRGPEHFVICEALTNVVKHAYANVALVSITAVNGHLSLLVRDDGKGREAAVGNGQGLTNLRDRVEALGGRFRVDGRPGEGTSVSADLPVGAPGA